MCKSEDILKELNNGFATAFIDNSRSFFYKGEI